MKKKIIFLVVLIIFILIFLGIIFKNNIENKTKDILNNSIENFYNYINKYNYSDKALLDVTAKYKGAHGSVNPVNFNYNAMLEKNETGLNAIFENNDGYNELNINNNLVDIYTKLRDISLDDFKKIVNIKSVDYKLGKIVFIFDVSYLNDILDLNVNKLELYINTNIIYFGINNYELYIDNNAINISSDFKEFNGNNFRLSINEKGYYLNYYNLKMNVILSEKDKYNINIDDLIFQIELSNNNIMIDVSKDINIYRGLIINIEFNDVDLKKRIKGDDNSNPIIRYFSNSNINLGD